MKPVLKMLTNMRKRIYFDVMTLRGHTLRTNYERFVREDRLGVNKNTTKTLLIQILDHCKKNVPYYSNYIYKFGDSFYKDPEEYLVNFPTLTKEVIRSRFDELKSHDIGQRKWYINYTSGSTGEPARFIQDWEYASKSGAIKLLYSKLAGREVGEPEVKLWGSDRDIAKTHASWKARAIDWIGNTETMNAFRLTPERIREFIAHLNCKRPKLIVAYVDSIYDLASYAKREGISIIPQQAIITSAGTLFSHMRELIETVFRCKVFDRYGSREVGDIACERPDCNGLWVAPWGTYIEVIDQQGNRLPNGQEGEILVTSLTNFAMPLIRYRIGDIGALSGSTFQKGIYGQILEKVLGRTVEVFENQNGHRIHPAYFLSKINKFCDWAVRLQIVQKNRSLVVIRMVTVKSGPRSGDLDEIVREAKVVMGKDCEIQFEFLPELPSERSGKHRHAICEIAR